MGNVTFFQALRRYWWIVVLFAAVGATIAAIPQPTEAADVVTTRYQASHTILVSSSQNQSIFNNPQAFNQLPLFATTGEVPIRAADALDFDGSPPALAAQVVVDLDQQTGALRISTTQDTAAGAVAVADTFAQELVGYLAGRQDEVRQERVTSALTRLQELEAQVREAERAASRLPDDAVLQAQLDGLSRQYSVAFEQYNALTAEDNNAQLVLTTLEFAEPIEITESVGLGAPRSRLSRGILGGLVGAVIGAGITFLVARADRKIRTRAQVEELLGMSAQVVVPEVSGHHPGDLAVVHDRHDPLSDSYRRLRSLLSFIHAGMDRTRPDDAPRRAPITLIVSPSAGDGKTSISANLASAFVEAGDRTVAVNADFRRPTLSRRLAVVVPDLSRYTLADLPSLSASKFLAPVAGVNLAVLDLAGLRGSSPGDLARATGRLLPRLSELSDQIVIDSSPVGATAETLELVPQADTIVLVVKLGHTSGQAARAALETIQRVSTGTVLLAVIGAEVDDSSDYYYYYSTKRQDGGDDAKRRFGWLPGRRRSGRGKGKGDDATSPSPTTALPEADVPEADVPEVAPPDVDDSAGLDVSEAQGTHDGEDHGGDGGVDPDEVTPAQGVPVVEPHAAHDR